MGILDEFYRFMGRSIETTEEKDGMTIRLTAGQVIPTSATNWQPLTGGSQYLTTNTNTGMGTYTVYGNYNSLGQAPIQASAGLQQAVYRPGTSNNNINTIPSHYHLAPPTGHYQTIAFTDASGMTYALQVDSAYAGILLQMSQLTGYMPIMPLPQPIMPLPQQKMVDGDFSLDELDQAETIIAELECGETGSKEVLRAS